MNILKRLKCVFGFHEPMKYITVEVYGKEFKLCANCGKRLEPREE